MTPITYTSNTYGPESGPVTEAGKAAPETAASDPSPGEVSAVSDADPSLPSMPPPHDEDPDPSAGAAPGHAQEQDPEPGPAASRAEDGAVKDPAAYQDFSLPQGFEVTPAILDEFKATAANLGLSQGQAQNLVDLQVKSNLAVAEAWQEQRAAWKREIANDPVYGKENLPATLKDARRTLSRYDPHGTLMADLERSGHGDNPSIIRFLAQIARDHLHEDQVHTSRHVPRQSIPLRDRLWPDSVMPG